MSESPFSLLCLIIIITSFLVQVVEIRDYHNSSSDELVIADR